jgi:hypothetical protein
MASFVALTDMRCIVAAWLYILRWQGKLIETRRHARSFRGAIFVSGPLAREVENLSVEM